MLAWFSLTASALPKIIILRGAKIRAAGMWWCRSLSSHKQAVWRWARWSKVLGDHHGAWHGNRRRHSRPQHSTNGPKSWWPRPKKIPDEVKEADKKARVDLRALPFVTIDGEDAKDFDDAVYCERNKSTGGWRLFVAIADVSHYVQPHSYLDKEAHVRGNSVYFPEFVVPCCLKSSPTVCAR